MSRRLPDGYFLKITKLKFRPLGLYRQCFALAKLELLNNSRADHLVTVIPDRELP